MTDLVLAGDFPAATEEQWRALVDKALAGESFDTLRANLYEGFATEPLETAKTARPASGGPLFSARGWHILQPVAGAAPEDARAQLGADLDGGATGIWLEAAGPGPNPEGFAAQTASDLQALFGPNLLNRIKVLYLRDSSSLASAAILSAYLEGTKPALRGSFGLDPLTGFAVAGELPADRSAMLADAVDAAFYLTERVPCLAPFLASDRAWHGSGGSAVQDLGFTLAATIAYWRALCEAGMAPSKAVRCVSLSLSADADLFLTIAKFRAARLLLRKAADAVAQDGSGADIDIVAEMSYRVMAERDPHNNLLRATAAAFGAAVGGASAIRVLPYDVALRTPTAFARRLARNTGIILEHESHLAAVADAASGSYYVERLTSELAERAWTLFQDVERRGGLAAALESGFLDAELRKTREERERAAATRKDKITGVSVYPNSAETSEREAAWQVQPLGDLPMSDLSLPRSGKGERFSALVAAARSGADILQLQVASRIVREPVATPLFPAFRAAAPFEALRRQSDAALTQVGSRPPVFLALFGSPSDWSGKASWAQGFFAAGGIETVLPEGAFADLKALASAFKASPAPVACLCGSSSAIAGLKGVAKALKNAGAVFVYLAGPASMLNQLEPSDAADIDRLIYEGCDAVALLSEAHRVLRVADLGRNADDDAG